MYRQCHKKANFGPWEANLTFRWDSAALWNLKTRFLTNTAAFNPENRYKSILSHHFEKAQLENKTLSTEKFLLDDFLFGPQSKITVSTTQKMEKTEIFNKKITYDFPNG